VVVAALVHRLVVIATLCAALFLTAGCGGGSDGGGPPTQTPGLFMTSLVREKATGQYELAWKSLHPLHQRVASEKDYIKCENQTVFPGHLIKVSVVRVIDEPVRIAGETESVASKAVTLKVAVNSPGIPKPVVVTDTYHAIAVDGHWTWILTADNFAQYKAGRCPGVAPPSTKA
jgi:hypothetical protein